MNKSNNRIEQRGKGNKIDLSQKNTQKNTNIKVPILLGGLTLGGILWGITVLRSIDQDTPKNYPKIPASLTVSEKKSLSDLSDDLKQAKSGNIKLEKANIITREILAKNADSDSNGYLTTPEFEKIDCPLLREVDQVWLRESGGKYGFSVQIKMRNSIQDKNKIWDDFVDMNGWRDGKDLSFQAPIGHHPYWNYLQDKNDDGGLVIDDKVIACGLLES